MLIVTANANVVATHRIGGATCHATSAHVSSGGVAPDALRAIGTAANTVYERVTSRIEPTSHVWQVANIRRGTARVADAGELGSFAALTHHDVAAAVVGGSAGEAFRRRVGRATSLVGAGLAGSTSLASWSGIAVHQDAAALVYSRGLAELFAGFRGAGRCRALVRSLAAAVLPRWAWPTVDGLATPSFDERATLPRGASQRLTNALACLRVAAHFWSTGWNAFFGTRRRVFAIQLREQELATG